MDGTLEGVGRGTGDPGRRRHTGSEVSGGHTDGGRRQIDFFTCSFEIGFSGKHPQRTTTLCPS